MKEGTVHAVFIICVTALFILCLGEPDLLDAIRLNLTPAVCAK